MLTLEKVHDLSKNSWNPAGVRFPILELGTVCGPNEPLLATGSVLVLRTPLHQRRYNAFKVSAQHVGNTLQDVILHKLLYLASEAGKLVLPQAALLFDEYPANMVSHKGPVNHFNLWLRLDEAGLPNLDAGDDLLAALTPRDPKLEAKCIQPVQSVAADGILPYTHCHVFSTSLTHEATLF